MLPTPPSSDAGSPKRSSHDAIYGPLKLSDKIIQTRFFKIKPGNEDDQIVCELSTNALQKYRKKYLAISYAWGETSGESGDPTRETIKINGHDFEISSNLAGALRMFRQAYPNELFWADAICHNQADAGEMNRQVSYMREIYQRCREVHIWLGHESILKHPASRTARTSDPRIVWNSPCLNNKCDLPADEREHPYHEVDEDRKRVEQYKEQFYAFVNRPEVLQLFTTQDFRLGSFCLLHLLARGSCLKDRDYDFMVDLSSRDGIFEALKEMMERLWWTRAWVIQETVLARVVVVHYGRFTFPWSMMAAAQQTLQVHRNKGCCTVEYAKLRTADLETFDLFTTRVRDIHTWRSIWFDQPGAQIKLLPLMWQFRQRESGRLPDKVYALLPLVKDWGQEKALAVHYDWEEGHIFADLVCLLIDVHNSLLPIMGTTSKNQKLLDKGVHIPTWAPDWSLRPDVHELARLERALLYAACGEAQNGLLYQTEDSVRFFENAEGTKYDYMELHGILHDKIKQTGGVMPATNAAEIRQAFLSWFTMACSTDGNYLNGPITHIEAYWRTLCMDTEYIGKENDDDNLPLARKDYQRASGDYARDYVSHINQIRNSREGAQEAHENGIKMLSAQHGKTVTWRPEKPAAETMARNRPYAPQRRTSTMKSDDAVDVVKNVNMAIKTATTDRVFFITEKGYMGLGPKEARIGDEVAILAGGHTPFILRTSEEKHIDDGIGRQMCRKLIGDCYVHGAMDGEVIRDMKKDDEEFIKLYLE